MRQETNAAFEGHWEHCDVIPRQVLATLAWATGDVNRPQYSLIELLAALTEHDMTLPRKTVSDTLERMVDEEVLRRDEQGASYSFAVPLYRRWLGWRWQPQRVRDEGGRLDSITDRI